MKKALIVTYYWPPSGGSGVQRWMYFASYLQKYGIEPVVITVSPDEAAYPAIDETLCKKVGHVRVYHTGAGFQLLKLYASMKRGKAKNQIPAGDFGDQKKTVFDRIAGYIRANYFIPDARVGWLKKVVPLADRLLANERFDFIITTGPPHSTHLAGLQLKKKHRVHWVADFRDPWREVYYNDLFRRSARSDRKDAALERSVLDGADTILTVGPSMEALLAAKTTDPGKVRHIYNGYDAELFGGIERVRYPEFTLAHIGVWTARQPFGELYEALKNTLAADPDLQLRFVIVGGNVASGHIERLRTLPRLIVDVKGKVSHSEALREMMNADLLLNCMPVQKESRIMITGKMMEYMATGNPIIAIGNPEGDAARVISMNPSALIVEPGDAVGIERRIRELISAGGSGAGFAQALLKRFSREETTRQLAELLRERLEPDQSHR